MHYAIGDVHGYYRDLMVLIGTIEKEDPDAHFILLGDLMDRGPDTLKVLYWAMNHVRPGSRYSCLRGNHEDLALQWYHHRFLPWEERCRSMDAALKEPLPKSKFDFSDLVLREGLARSEALQPIMEFLDSLPFSLELSTVVRCADAPERGLSASPLEGPVSYRLVHGWYNKKVPAAIMQRHLNLRGRVYSGNPDSSFIIVHGHTPTTSPEYIAADPAHTRPGCISYRPHAINTDGGRAEEAFQGNPTMLCGICLETLKEYYVHE